MWLLIAVIVFLLLILNLFQWRRDFERIRKLDAARKKISFEDLGDQAPLVSFLLAAWNEESTLRPSVDAVLHLGYPNLEIVVCAGGTDRTWQIASEFSDSRLILLNQQPGDGKQKSLARCLNRASGEIIYLLDAGGQITDSAFARMLGPILSRNEQAVTSIPCTPFPEQLASPFVVSQCACRVYTSIYQPEYCSGLSGANSVIRRPALEQAGGFRAELGAGGDYDLGKHLVRAGIRIRYDARASFPIEFHTKLGAYLRQQARWLRTVVIHGIRFRAYREVASCLLTSLVGLAMLVLPFLALAAVFLGISSAIVRICATAWAIGLGHAFLSRLRYLKVAALWLGIRVHRNTVALLPVFLLIDFLAWTIPLFQYPSKQWRHRW
ncbi:MAG TPA: glycosyltransferase family 2 protein [Bryobacteraceae bacterium]|nr:glycosyltransferase family 2 protein [Bryobacteraceae bacterium]